MEIQNTQQRTIWGKWWLPIRKWFYTSWLLYETSIRFYDYAKAVYQYFDNPALAISSAILTFSICVLSLTIPCCFLLYKLFSTSNLTRTRIEEEWKPYF